MHKIHQSSIAKEMHSLKTFKLRTLKMCALNYTCVYGMVTVDGIKPGIFQSFNFMIS